MLDFKFLKSLICPESAKFLKKLIEYVNTGKVKTRKHYFLRTNENITSLIEKRTVFDASGRKIFEFEYQVEGYSYNVRSGVFERNKKNTLFWYKLTYLDENTYISDKDAYKLYKAIITKCGDKQPAPDQSKAALYDKILQDQNARRAKIVYEDRTK